MHYTLSFCLLALVLLLPACHWSDNNVSSGLFVNKNWHAESIALWNHDRPDMLHLSKDGTMLFLSFENKGISKGMLQESPALGRIDLQTGASEILLRGLVASDGLRLDSQGDLWLGEEFSDGYVWHIHQPQSLPAEQHIKREKKISSHPNITLANGAGRMSHEGLAFSRDGQYLYLLDEWHHGGLYRLHQTSKQLQVFNKDEGWLAIAHPDDARVEAQKIGATPFNRGEDMETLPDGRIAFAETETATIHILDDSGKRPTVLPWLRFKDIEHPDNLKWDQHRNWLWITDDSQPSELWVWDGTLFHRILTYHHGEITGVETDLDGRVWINLKGETNRMDQTILLTEHE